MKAVTKRVRMGQLYRELPALRAKDILITDSAARELRGKKGKHTEHGF